MQDGPNTRMLPMPGKARDEDRLSAPAGMRLLARQGLPALPGLAHEVRQAHEKIQLAG